MTTIEWVGEIGLICTLMSGHYFIIMNGVDGKIDKAMNKMKDDKIQELIRANERLVAKNDMLKEGLQKMK